MKAAFSFETIMLVLEIVMLIFFGVLMVRAIGAFMNPDLQTAVLNTQVLASKINEACISGSSTMDGFSLTQPKPSKTFLLFTDALSKFSIKSSGDPHYVLYYEAFPYGEGYGWEVLNNFDNRIFTYYETVLPQDGLGKEEFENALWKSLDQDNYIVKIDRLFQSKLSTPEGADALEKHPELLSYSRYILVNNIELSDDLGAIPAYSVFSPSGENSLNINNIGTVPETPSAVVLDPEERIRTITESFGEWDESCVDSKTNNCFFKFKNYRGLNDLEQSFVKYRPCGDNALCLKTREGVYRFPLVEGCENVKYIAINYDATASNPQRWTQNIVGGAVVITIAGGILTGSSAVAATLRGTWAAGKLLLGSGIGALLGTILAAQLAQKSFWVLAMYTSYKKSDMYFASPCDIDSKIEIQKVDCNSNDMNKICPKSVEYPIYQYSGDKVIKVGDHVSCLYNTGEDFQSDFNTMSPLSTRSGDCIILKISEKPNDFCWTANPKVDVSVSTLQESDKALLSKTGAQPITDNTFFIGDAGTNAVVVKKFENKAGTSGAGKHLFSNIFDVDWVWPRGYMTQG